MKVIKKILAGAMALTMAAGMMLSTAVQAGATEKSDGTHEYELKCVDYSDYGMASKKIQFGPFTESEWKKLKKTASEYEFGKNGYLFIGVWLSDKDSDNSYSFGLALDKNFANESTITAYNIPGAGETLSGYRTNKKDGKYYFELEFEGSEFSDGFSDCEIADWLIVICDENGKDKATPLGDNKTKSTICDFIVEKYATNGDNKVVKHIKADDNTKENDISSLSFSKISKKTYTGKSIKPVVTIKNGDKKLKKGTDYTVSYKNNKKIGTAAVTIKGKGDYTGEKTIEFKIVPKKTTLKVSKKSDTKATFSWTEVKGAEKYQIYVSKDGGKTYKLFKSVSGSKTSYTSSKLDFEKYDYKFKIRSYGTSDGKKYYSSYSKVKTVK